MIPKAKSWIPPIKRIIETRLAQPATLPPMVNFLMMTKIIPTKEIKNEKVPAHVASFKGTSEKLIKPSSE
jgi:hypothetical protein